MACLQIGTEKINAKLKFDDRNIVASAAAAVERKQLKIEKVQKTNKTAENREGIVQMAAGPGLVSLRSLTVK